MTAIDAMTTIACVLKSGGDYDIEYVERLRDGVRKHLHAPYRFVCMSDVDVPCERIPLRHDFAGWWAKLELFYLDGPVLFFDLDTVIAGDITPIVEYDHVFTAVSDFYRPRALQSCMMAWSDATPFRGIIDDYLSDPISAGRSHQKYLERYIKPVFFQDLWPGKVVSYKATRNRAGASVVCYHGKPRPRDTGWAT
jgi:hypothetical protein